MPLSFFFFLFFFRLTNTIYSGSGPTTTLDLSLNHVVGPQNLEDVGAAHFRLNAGMLQRSKCLDEQLKTMSNHGWVDAKTKAVIVEFCVVPFYLTQFWTRNINTTLRRGLEFEEDFADDADDETFGTGGCQRILFEYDQFGYVDASQSFITSPISTWQSKNEHLIVITVLLVSLGLLLWGECLEIYITGAMTYLCTRSRALFNLLDLCAIIFIILTIVSYPSNGVAFGPEDFATMTSNPEQTHLTFARLYEMDVTRQWFSAVLIVWWARSLEYLTLFPSLQVPVFTISRASVPILSILVFIGMVLFAVSTGANIVFGGSVAAFSNLPRTLVTLIQASLGEIVLDGFSDDTRWSTSGPVFLSLWAFLMMFVVLTMFVAIIDGK